MLLKTSQIIREMNTFNIAGKTSEGTRSLRKGAWKKTNKYV